MLVDSHCHVALAQFDDDRPAVLERARLAGVGLLIDVGIGPGSWERTLHLAGSEPGVHAALGLHPNDVADAPADAMARLADLIASPRVVAVGETGLDYHWRRASPEQQRTALLAHLDLALRSGLPVIFHCREAYDDLLDVLTERGQGVRGVLHCFGGTPDQARRALDLGLMISMAGPVTFRSAGAIREVVALVPSGRLLLETDAPYLSPHPHRGQRNEPARVAAVAAAVAEARGESVVEVAAHTTASACALFGLAPPA